MKKILILAETDNSQVMKIYSAWQKKYTFFIAHSGKECIKIVDEKEVDLLVCDFSSSPTLSLAGLQQFLTDCPYLPCITVINQEEHSADNFTGGGINATLPMPVTEDTLHLWTTKLLELTGCSVLRGLPVPSVLQMLAAEEKTCTLKVITHSKIGKLYIAEGAPVAAEFDDLKGEDAVYAMIAADCLKIELTFYNGQRVPEIDKPLMALIMEAFRLRDEKESLNALKGKGGDKVELKHFFTTDSQLQLETGYSVKLEQGEENEQLTATLVGMRKEKYLVVAQPEKLTGESSLLEEKEITVRYLHSGRLCMFKSAIIKQTDEPDHLIFLAYPEVVYYHNLRQAKRANIYIPCTMALANGSRYNCILMDISETGCLCQLKAENEIILPEADSTTSLFCLFPGISEEHEFEGVIRNITHEKEEVRMGIEFSTLKRDQSELIVNYLKSLFLL